MGQLITLRRQGIPPHIIAKLTGIPISDVLHRLATPADDPVAASGGSMDWKSTWDPAASYAIGQVVKYNGHIYIATAAVTPGTLPALPAAIRNPTMGLTVRGQEWLVPGVQKSHALISTDPTPPDLASVRYWAWALRATGAGNVALAGNNQGLGMFVTGPGNNQAVGSSFNLPFTVAIPSAGDFVIAVYGNNTQWTLPPITITATGAVATAPVATPAEDTTKWEQMV